jgi:hypothetical protein
MDYAESAKERLENHWQTKLEAARARYSENACVETKANYRSMLKTFADLVLRDAPPEDARGG